MRDRERERDKKREGEGEREKEKDTSHARRMREAVTRDYRCHRALGKRTREQYRTSVHTNVTGRKEGGPLIMLINSTRVTHRVRATHTHRAQTAT